MRQKLMYLVNTYAEVGTTPYGYEEWDGIDQYKDARCREKVIFRLDLMQGLTDFFTTETLTKYRGAIYRLMSGKIRDKEKISSMMNELYRIDSQFKTWLGVLLYFTNTLTTQSPYSCFIESIRESMEFLEKKVNATVGGTATYVAVSEGYIYFAAVDANVDVTIPEGLAEEVVSRAKVWKGTFERRK